MACHTSQTSHLTQATKVRRGIGSRNDVQNALGSHIRAIDEPSQRVESGLTNGSVAFSRHPRSRSPWAGTLSPVDSKAGDVTSCEKSLLQLRVRKASTKLKYGSSEFSRKSISEAWLM